MCNTCPLRFIADALHGTTTSGTKSDHIYEVALGQAAAAAAAAAESYHVGRACELVGLGL